MCSELTAIPCGLLTRRLPGWVFSSPQMKAGSTSSTASPFSLARPIVPPPSIGLSKSVAPPGVGPVDVFALDGEVAGFGGDRFGDLFEDPWFFERVGFFFAFAF